MSFGLVLLERNPVTCFETTQQYASVGAPEGFQISMQSLVLCKVVDLLVIYKDFKNHLFQ